ncbi:MAG TPA: addiction module protein [Thermoanaerobaculia bacterium]|nr:addiction module protein [Thermoanaerobaculia bacterium]
MNLADIEAEALKLNPNGRAKLATTLLHSLEDLSEAEIENLWFEEAERRDRELDEGGATAIPAEEVLREIRARLR